MFLLSKHIFQVTPHPITAIVHITKTGYS